ELGTTRRVDRVVRLADMLKVPKRCFDGRDLLDVGRSTERQRAGSAVDSGGGKPALGARDETEGRIEGAPSGVLAPGERATLIPGQCLRPLALVGKIEKRRKQRARLEGGARGELRNGEHLESARRVRRLDDRCDGDGAVGRAEIDPDDVARSHNSTSAGASTSALCPATGTGNSSLVARQPR